MTALRDAVLARLAEIREAEAAAVCAFCDRPGVVWTTRAPHGRINACPSCIGYLTLAETAGVYVGPLLLAADHRATLGPLAEGLAEEVGQHGCEWTDVLMWRCVRCDHSHVDPARACPFVLRWANVLGVTA